MILRAVLGREAVAWLRARPAAVQSFAESLSRVRSGIDLGEPIKERDNRHLQRLFRFGPEEEFIAVFEINTAKRTIRVNSCRSIRPDVR